MILQPLVHPVLIAVLAAALLFVVASGMRRAQGVGSRLLWVGRIVLVLACIAMLLRPGIPGVPGRIAASGLDVLVVVDTTASIVAEDWDGDRPRLDGVRDDVDAIVEAYPGARFALVTFDAEAQLRMPFSHDTTALGSAMEILAPEVTDRSRGSSIGVAHALVAQTLRSAAETGEGQARLVFYLGDGEQTSGGEPESFAESAPFVDGGLVLGYGTAEGGRMKRTSGTLGDDADAGYISYEGADALSVIDDEALGAIASDLGVAYQRRDAASAPDLPAAPRTTVDHATTASARIVGDLTWIPAIAFVAVLLLELGRATLRVVQLRRLAAPASAAVPPEPVPDPGPASGGRGEAAREGRGA
ncbi:VWA domain-containing protein [Microbacterium sp. No. 7]|uniref:VWA domain-containing protein n=1 Tax=Microbacterium sp. No. 7 TaxID=1714373 RepID=UPI0009E81680|nr:VWA domain-containing protein [Microbacterium sp. No. 7]